MRERAGKEDGDRGGGVGDWAIGEECGVEARVGARGLTVSMLGVGHNSSTAPGGHSGP